MTKKILEPSGKSGNENRDLDEQDALRRTRWTLGVEYVTYRTN